MAAKNNCFEVAELLIRSGADIHAHDKVNTTPIFKKPMCHYI